MEIKSKFSSLKVILSSVSILFVTVLTMILVSVSYTSSSRFIEEAFTNQINNFIVEVNRQIVDMYEQQKIYSGLLSRNPNIVNAFVKGDFYPAKGTLTGFYKGFGHYENLFLSTPEEDSVILIDVNGNSVGMKWKSGFEENIKAALDNRPHISHPQKSPITGTPVILVTTPVSVNNKVIGILGCSIDFVSMTDKIISNVKIGSNGYIFLLNNKGIVIGYKDRNLVFKLDVNQFEWGRKMLSSPDKTIVEYTWGNAEKLSSLIRNEDYGIISVASFDRNDISTRTRTMVLIMSILGLVCIVSTAFLIYYIISRRLNPLEKCKEIIQGMSEGDLTRRYTDSVSKDEIGEIVVLLNGSLDQFESAIADTVSASNVLIDAVGQISAGNQSLSQRTAEQASSVEEIAAIIEQATATIRQNTANAKDSDELVEKTSQLADEGGVIVNATIQSINEIQDSSKKIGEITSVINEIAFQTNLLALNAAVEAARAGENGRGFAVVAGEVRNLAQRSSTAVKEIESLIRNSQGKVEKGTEMVNRNGVSLKNIIDSIKSLKNLISEVANASDEQQRGMEQISTAITEMDTMTQQNASLVEETASASEEMSTQAQELQRMMSRFKVTMKETEQFRHAPFDSRISNVKNDISTAVRRTNEASIQLKKEFEEF